MHGRLGAKHHQNVERIGTCDFCIFAKSIMLKPFWGTIKGSEIENKSVKIGMNSLIEKMVPKLCQNGCKRASHATEIETLPLQAQAPEMLPI